MNTPQDHESASRKRPAPKPDRFEPFRKWIVERGAELLVPTNEWELVRWRAYGATSIIYTSAAGNLTFAYQAREAWEAFARQDNAFRFTPRAPRRKVPVEVQTLLDRDGPHCFYCAAAFGEAVRPTREHLVPVTAGGPDHIGNMFLACQPCNRDVGHRSAPEKIRYRDRRRRGVGSQLLQRVADIGAPEAIMADIVAFLNPAPRSP